MSDEKKAPTILYLDVTDEEGWANIANLNIAVVSMARQTSSCEAWVRVKSCGSLENTPALRQPCRECGLPAVPPALGPFLFPEEVWEDFDNQKRMAEAEKQEDHNERLREIVKIAQETACGYGEADGESWTPDDVFYIVEGFQALEELLLLAEGQDDD